MKYANKKPWMWAVYLFSLGIPLVLFIAFCCVSHGKKSENNESDTYDAASSKKTDHSAPDVIPEVVKVPAEIYKFNDIFLIRTRKLLMKGPLLKKFKKMILRMLKRRRRRRKLKKSVKCALHHDSAVLERIDTTFLLCFIIWSCDWSLVIHLIYSYSYFNS